MDNRRNRREHARNILGAELTDSQRRRSGDLGGAATSSQAAAEGFSLGGILGAVVGWIAGKLEDRTEKR